MIRVVLFLAVYLASATVTAESLSPEEQRMADWIDAHSEDAVALLKETVDISFVAPHTDALAGLGCSCEGGHTPDEFVRLLSMPLAVKRAAILIYRLSKQEVSD